MTLRLAVELTATGDDLARDIRQVKDEVKSLGAEAANANRQSAESARQAVTAFADHAEKIKAAATAMQQYQAAARSAAAIDRQFGIGGRNSAARAADIAAYGQELDKLRARFSPLFAAQQAYRRELTDLNHALRVGAISQREFDAALARTKNTFAAQVVQINGFRGGLINALGQVGRFRTQIQGMGYQVGDLAVQLASGQNALVAFAQQGGQALQLFGGPWGAVIGAAMSIVAALAIAMFDFGDATEEAADAAEKAEERTRKLSEAYSGLKDVMDAINGVQQRSRESLEADQRNRIALIRIQAEQARGALAAAEAELALQEARNAALRASVNVMGTGAEFGTEPLGLLDTTEAQAAVDTARKARRELDLTLLTMRALAGEFDDGRKLAGQTFEEIYYGAEKAAKGTKALKSATGDLTDSVQALIDTFEPLPGSFAALARAEANLELQYERGQIEAHEYARRLKELYDTHDALNAKQDATGQATERAVERSVTAARDGHAEIARFIGETAEGIGRAITDGFARGEIAAVKWGNIARAAISDVMQWAVSLAALNPLRNWIDGGSRPTLGSVFGGGTAIQTASGQSVGGIGGGVTGFGGFSLGGLLGDGPGLGTMLFGTAAVPVRTIGNYGATVGGAPATSGLFGSGGGGQFGAFLNSPIGGGIASGLLALGGSLLSGQDIGPSLITAGLTGVGTAIAGPIGGLVGGLLGSVFGGLFGSKKPKLKKDEAEASLIANRFGLPFVLEQHDDSKLGDLGGQLGALAQRSVTDLLTRVGAVMDPDLRARLSYYHSTKGGKTKSEFFKAGIFGEGFTGEIGRYGSAEEAAAALAAGALFASGLTGNIRGTGASTQRAFEAMWARARRTSEGIAQFNAERLIEIIDFTKWIDGLDKVRTTGDAATKALIDFEGALAKAQSQAEELGLTAEQAFDAMKRDFTEAIQDELLQLTDPQAFALRALEQEYAAREAVAEELGLDLVELEKLYALKRQEVLDQGLKGVASSWKDFINQLQFGPQSALSPSAQLEQARLQYEASKATGGAAFREAATTYLGLSRQFYGGTMPYAQLYQEVIALAKQFGGLEDIPGYAAGTTYHPGGLMFAGEQGTELIWAPRGTRVFNRAETAAILRDLLDEPAQRRADLIERLTAGQGRSFPGGMDMEERLRWIARATDRGANRPAPAWIDQRRLAEVAERLEQLHRQDAERQLQQADSGLAVARGLAQLGQRFDALAEEQARMNRTLRRVVERK